MSNFKMPRLPRLDAQTESPVGTTERCAALGAEAEHSVGQVSEPCCVCVPEINYLLVERKLIHNA